MNQFYNPVKLFMGTESLPIAVELLEQKLEQVERVLVLTRGGAVHGDPVLAPLIGSIQKNEYYVKEITISNPDLDDLLALKNETDCFDYELIVSIGGGSVMDMTKSLIAFRQSKAMDKESMRQAVLDHEYAKSGSAIPWIGIPTTSGTGSEVTSWATVWDKQLNKKYSITDEKLYAEAAIILPELTETLPLKLSVITALDALCHATEAYWSVHTNPVTRVYAVEAISRITRSLPELGEATEDLAVRQELALGSMYAGLAFSNTRTTACHSISYPLTLLHGVEHGLAASLTLASVMEINEPEIVQFDRLLAAYGAESIEDVRQFFISVYQQYGLPFQLRDYAVTRSNIHSIVAGAFTKGRMDNNPVELTEHSLTGLIEKII